MAMYEPPSIVITIRYLYYKHARDKDWEKNISLENSYSSFGSEVSQHSNAIGPIITNSVKVHTPVSFGYLNQSIETGGPRRAGPIESLEWQRKDPSTGSWYSVQENMPEYYDHIFICSVNKNTAGVTYAMPVEIGSVPHSAPTNGMMGWVLKNWGNSDPNAVWKLRAIIRKRGTPDYLMFWKGWSLAVSEINFSSSSLLDPTYWDLYASEYHIAPVEV